MGDESLTYEHLVCKAFGCGRLELPFANADTFRLAKTEDKQAALRNYVLASLRSIILYQRESTTLSIYEACQNCFDELSDGKIDVDEVIARFDKYVI